MAFLKDMLALADDKLHEVFSTPPHDPEKARKPLLAGIEKTRTQFNEGKTKVPHRWWSASNNVVEFAPKVNGSVLRINGKEKTYVPAERFGDFLNMMEQAVKAGEFDAELENHGKGDAKVSTPRAPRKPREGGGTGWSDERRARFQASIAARNAAKNG